MTFVTTMDNPKSLSLNKYTIIIMVVGISILFLLMIQGFLKALFLAAIFAGILHPLYKRILKKTKKKSSLSAILVILLVFFIILVPLTSVFVVIFNQAVNVGETTAPLVKEFVENPNEIAEKLERIPIVHDIFPDTEKFLAALDNVVKRISGFIVDELSAITTGAASFIFSFFIFLYALYFFLVDGRQYLDKMLYYLPLKNEEEDILMSRFLTVTRATLKGSFVVGFVQGAAGAIALFLLGVPNVLFWGMIMTICSLIPALGSGLVWIPAAIYLIVIGSVTKGIILIVVGVLIIGNIDNLLRPRLVGKDAKMPDLMILFSTLGGITLFGISGLIIGPIIAAIFISIWEIYAKAFESSLYERGTTTEILKDNDDLEKDTTQR